MTFKVTKKENMFFVQRDVDNQVFLRSRDKNEAIAHAKKLSEEENEWKQGKTIEIFETKS